MQPKFVNRDESAWDMGDFAYDLGDTLEMAIEKAADYGIKPGGHDYAEFITAFARRVRSKQVSPRKMATKHSEAAAIGSAIVLTPDFSRTAS